MATTRTTTGSTANSRPRSIPNSSTMSFNSPSPKKRKITTTNTIINDISQAHLCQPHHISSTSDTSEIVPKTRHTHAELWKWTLSRDSIASCEIADVYTMVECKEKKANIDPDFFWLGHIPVRSVRIVGTVVGVQIYENRTLYTVDDGTEVIDCNLRHPKLEPLSIKHSPKKSRAPDKHSHSETSTRSKYKPPLAKPNSIPKSNTTSNSIPLPPPKPVAEVMDPVRVVGKVLNRYQSRMINIETIERCKYANEEPQHWLAVHDLHSTYYHSPSSTPFVIPKHTATTIPPTSPSKLSPTYSLDHDNLSRLSIDSESAMSTPRSSHSSASSVAGPQSPPRLRHPSRLHTRDLTANTFRIYVKHYMDNAPPEPFSFSLSSSHASDVNTSDTSDSEVSETEIRLLRKKELTPTKQRRRLDLIARALSGPDVGGDADETPRATRVFATASKRADDTPRDGLLDSPTTILGGQDAQVKGFTLSHLRRVPELSLLARRVILFEAKRREKEERKKLKEQQTASKLDAKLSVKVQTNGKLGSTQNKVQSKTKELLATKTKRLYKFVIRQLYEEGAIVLWDGPVRGMPRAPIPAPDFLGSVSQGLMFHTAVETRLWKTPSSTSTSYSSVGHRGNVSSVSGDSSIAGGEDEDEGDLSDPAPNEESYIPLTPSLLLPVLEQGITDILTRPRKRVRPAHLSGDVPIKRVLGPPLGPTHEELVEYVRGRDERWMRVSEWAINEALEWGREQGRVWSPGQGRWECCG